MKNSCLLDKNVVLDILEKRTRFDSVLEVLAKYQNLYISSNCFLTIFYFAKKIGRTKQDIFLQLQNFQILEIGQLECYQAVDLSKNIDDVEDCCELILAKKFKFDLITADKEFVEKYSYSGFVFVK